MTGQWGTALTVELIDGALERCNFFDCPDIGQWAVNYVDDEHALPTPVRSCGRHLAATARQLAGAR